MPWVPHARVSARFNLGPGTSENENASCTLNFASGAVVMGDLAIRENVANECFTAWSTYISDGGSYISTAVRLMEVRVYKIGADGKADGPPGISDLEPVKGTTASNQHPFQVSNVVTLVASPGGKGRFGRIYLPPQGFGLEQDTSRMTGSPFTGMADRAFAFLADISNRPGLDAGWGLRIAGRTGAGTLRDVVETRFGKVPDTQRRRRTNLLEGYYAQPFSS